MTSSHTDLPLIERARSHVDRIAISADGGTYTYAELLTASAQCAATLLGNRTDLDEARVAFLCPPDLEYAATQWGIWRAGGIAVPLCVTHPAAELAFVLDDAEPTIVVAHPEFENRLRPLAKERGIDFLTTEFLFRTPPASTLPSVAWNRGALMVYTSGTTAKPKGVVTTHANVTAQVTSLIEAWRWREDDSILLALPLHHVHGIVNVLTCALWAGAHCEMLPAFDARAVWSRFASGDLTLFMAVPLIYRRLIAAWDDASPSDREAMSAGCTKMRLMVSGSAALPVPTLERWREITGHVLLERYGMTETGMICSNPVDGERVPGAVGVPLPGVEVRLVAPESGNGQEEVPDGEPGTVEVRGPGVFREYWRRPDETTAAFHDGWFVTGDIAVRESGRYRILGRQSIDIIKTGGYKVSALEIEAVLQMHPSIVECAVVGVEDEEWGERVCAAVELSADADLTLEQLKEWAKEHLAPYKIPRTLKIVGTLPRNAMGKITKPEVATLF